MAKKGKVLSKAKNAPKDFQKDKRKVGKKKKEAANATKTDYKVKQVNMPSQTALAEKGEEVTSRGSGLLELLAHLQHHSGKVRRDALLGLQELCTAHPTVLRSSLARIVDATTQTPIDTYAEVRSGFAKFMEWLIGAASCATIVSFAPSLSLHVRSALSHVSSEVRMDGLELLELYLRELSATELFNQAEVAKLIGMLCQLTSETEAVLPCLLQLLRYSRAAPADSSKEATVGQDDLAAQVSVQTVLQGRFAMGGARQRQVCQLPQPEADKADEDSPVWAFCLRAWLQAGAVPSGVVSGKANMEQAARPARMRLVAVAVLECALESAQAADGRSWGTLLSPSSSQLAALVGFVRRNEWPMHVDQRGTFRCFADALNLRAARVFALAASTGEGLVFARLAAAAAQFMDEHGANAEGAGAVAGGRGGAAGEAHDLLLSGAAATRHALRTLDVLWAVASRTSRGVLTQQDIEYLLSATSRLATGEGTEASILLSPQLLAVPLTASLLGLRPCSASAAPSALQAAWPEALGACGEPAFLDTLERLKAGVCLDWLSVWPRLLLYLGNSDPAASSFILVLLLEFAKKAAQPGSAYEAVFPKICPLLAPFFGARPKGVPSDVAPPIAWLPGEAQVLGALLVPHFPKLTGAFVPLLTRLACRWSLVGTAGDAEEAGSRGHLCIEASEAILEALLPRRAANAEDQLPTQLRVALSVLTALPAAAPTSLARARAAERDAVRLARGVALWLMADVDAPGSGCPEGRKRLALRTLVWPLCREVLATDAALAPRALCFMHFCASHLPAAGELGASRSPGGDFAWLTLSRQFFDTMLLGGDARALRPPPSGEGPAAGVGASAALPTVGGDRQARACTDEAGEAAEATRRLGRLFVDTWMRLAPAGHGPDAYEALVKLCVQQICVAASDVRGGQNPSKVAKTEEGQTAACRQRGVLMASVQVLQEAVAHRNEHSFSTSSWGAPAMAGHLPQAVVGMTVNDVRSTLSERLAELLADCAEPSLTTLLAMLALL